MALKKLTKTEGDGKDFELPSEGQQVAILVAIIDLGTQHVQFKGVWQQKAKVALVWELLEGVKSDEDGSPFLMVADYTASLGGGTMPSNLAKLIKDWLGKSIPDGQDYDYCAPAKEGGLLGRYCLVSVEHKESQSGKKDKDGKPRVFARIAAVAGVPKQMQASAAKMKPQTTPFTWDIEEKELPALADTLYLYGQKLADHIAAAVERGGKRGEGNGAEKPKYDVAGTRKQEEEEDPPF